jgi:hypothetical protein
MTEKEADILVTATAESKLNEKIFLRSFDTTTAI